MGTKGILGSIVVALALVACGGPLEYKVASTPKAPGADATIVADVEEARNTTTLTVEVVNLAPADRIAPGAAHFVIWQRKNSSAVWARVGTLEYDAESREGKFEGTVPESKFDLVVSAEKGLEVASPSGDLVFSQRVSK